MSKKVGEMTQPLEAVLLGAGNRGYYTQGAYAERHPDRLRYVAVAEPDAALRDRFGDRHGIPPARRFASWQDLLDQGQLAPALVNTTPDRVHLASTLAALEAGYDVLLEKPMATTAADCVRIVETAERLGRILQVNHGLRYAPFFALIHEVLASGRLGQIGHYSHFENVAHWHLAHSYVRGNWRSAEASGPMILTKCCHDLDLIGW
jgi:predicted dehydrogenase